MSTLHVRWLIRRDAIEVLPWLNITEEELFADLRSRLRIGLVAETMHEKIVGVLVMELGLDHLEIVRFAIRPGQSYETVGVKLIKKMISKLSQHRRNRLTIDVRESDLPQLLFLKSMGFKALGLNRGQFDEEDGITMEYRLPAAVLSEV